MEFNTKVKNETMDTVNSETENETINPAKGKAENETADTVLVKEKDHVAKLEAKIIKQLEYYFNNPILPYDKFLQNQIKTEDGWVNISVLSKFKRLTSISNEPIDIVSVVKNSVNTILEVDETNEKIRCKADIFIPVVN